jgi:hypothetical protein
MGRERIRLKPEAPKPTPRPRTTPTLTILDAINDPHLFRPWFKDPTTWAAWVAFLCALFGLPLDPEQLATYRQCTGRNDAPTQTASEAWLVIGRRGGKSFILALIAVFLACFHDYRQYLAPGERGTVFIIATDRKQARIILRYIQALLTRVPMLSRLIEREWAEGFDLANSVSVEVATASFRSVRGYTIVATLADELAFWSSEDSANPDTEVLAALRPAMATIPAAMLLCASSPYARKGALWDAHRRHFAKDLDHVLVWQAATRVMNPTVPQSFIDEAYEQDPANAAAEYGALFRSDIEGFVIREVVEACVTDGVFEREPRPGLRYTAFTDPSGGSSDSFTLAIAHKDTDNFILDCVREVKPPFSPEGVVSEFAQVCKSYRISKVTGDRYAGEWPREQFRKCGIQYELSSKPASDLYRDLLPLLNSRRVELLDNKKLIAQLTSLERRTARSGRDQISHPAGSHDDIANAVAGTFAAISLPQQKLTMRTLQCQGGPPSIELDPRTGRPLNAPEPKHIRWITVPESAIGAVKGIAEGPKRRMP